MKNERELNITKMVKTLQKFNSKHVNDTCLPLSVKLQVQLMIEDTCKTNEVDEEQVKMLVDSCNELIKEYNLPLWTMLDVHELCHMVHNLNRDINCSVAV